MLKLMAATLSIAEFSIHKGRDLKLTILFLRMRFMFLEINGVRKKRQSLVKLITSPQRKIGKAHKIF